MKRAKQFIYLVGPPAHFISFQIADNAISAYAHLADREEIVAAEVILKTRQGRTYVIRLKSLLLQEGNIQTNVDPDEWEEVLAQVEEITFRDDDE